MAYTNPSHTRGEGENVEEIEVNPGDVILVGRQIGALRYAGPLYDPMGEPSVDQFIGIELTEPTGGTDGSFGGRRYFVAEPGHGLFVPSSSIDRVLTAWELLKKVKEQHAVVTQILYQLNQCMAQLQQSNERKLYLENELRRYQQQLEHQNISPSDRIDGPGKTQSSPQVKTTTNSKPITPETPAWLATHISLPTPTDTAISLKKPITLDVPNRSPPPNESSLHSLPNSVGRGSQREPSPAALAPTKSPGPSFDVARSPQQRVTPPITRLTSTEVEPPTPVRPDPTMGSSSTLFTEDTYQQMYQQQPPPPPPPLPTQSLQPQPHFAAPSQSPQPHYSPMEYGHPHHRAPQHQSPPQQQQYNTGYYDMHSPAQRSPYVGMQFRQPQQSVQRYPGGNGYSPYNPDPHSQFTPSGHSPQTPYHNGPTPHSIPPGTPLYTHQTSQSPPPPSGTNHFHPSRSPAAPTYHQPNHVVGGHPSRVQQQYRESGPGKSPQPMQQTRAIRMKDPYNHRRAVHPAQFGPEKAIILTVDETFPWMDSFGPNRPAAHSESHQNGMVTVRACFHTKTEALQGLSRIQSRHVQSYLESEGPLPPGPPPQSLQRTQTSDSFQIEAPPKNMRDAKRDDESVSLSEPPENSQTDDEPLQSVIWAVESPASSVAGGA